MRGRGPLVEGGDAFLGTEHWWWWWTLWVLGVFFGVDPQGLPAGPLGEGKQAVVLISKSSLIGGILFCFLMLAPLLGLSQLDSGWMAPL